MGFINVKKCFKEPQQILKLIILIVCVCFTLYQLSECITKLLHPPVSTYYKFDLNETMKYPSLTFCRKSAYKKELFQKYGLKKVDLDTSKAFQSFKFENYSLEEFLEETTYSFQEMLLSYGFSGNGDGMSGLKIKESFHLHYGRCITLTPTRESSKFSIGGGYFLFFSHNVAQKTLDTYGVSESGFQIYLHDENEILSSELEQQNNFLEYIYLETAEHLRVKLKVQKYNQISTADEPCIDDETYSQSKCQEECVHLQVAKKVGCTTSWLKLPLNISYPTCSEYNTLNNLLLGITIESNRAYYLQNCKCLKSCNISVYTTYIMNSRDIYLNHKSNSIIMLYYDTNVIEVMSKVITYDWSIFLSDIGGSLGFLLGLSVIGVIAALEEIFKISINRYFKTKIIRPESPKIEDTKNNLNNYKQIMDSLKESNFSSNNFINRNLGEHF